MDTPIANDIRAEPTGSPVRPDRAGGGEPVGGPSRRFSAQRKLEAVGRLMRGEPLELVARELNVTAARVMMPPQIAVSSNPPASMTRTSPGRAMAMATWAAELSPAIQVTVLA